MLQIIVKDIGHQRRKLKKDGRSSDIESYKPYICIVFLTNILTVTTHRVKSSLKWSHVTLSFETISHTSLHTFKRGPGHSTTGKS